MPLTPDNISDMSLLPSKLSTTTNGFPGFKSPQLINHNENRFRFDDDKTIENSTYIASGKNSPQGLKEIVMNVTQSQIIPRMKLSASSDDDPMSE